MKHTEHCWTPDYVWSGSSGHTLFPLTPLSQIVIFPNSDLRPSHHKSGRTAEQKYLWESLIPLARNWKLKEPLQTLTECKNSSLPHRGRQKTLLVSIDQNMCRIKKLPDSIHGSYTALCLDLDKWFDFSILFKKSNKNIYPRLRIEASSMFLTHSQLLK